MYGADVIIIVVYVVCMALCWHRGLLQSLFHLCSWVISMVMAVFFYEPVGRFLREQTGLYLWLKENIASYMILSEPDSAGIVAQNNAIGQTPLPDFMQASLMENNNPVIHQILESTNVAEYISGYLANVCINILSVLIVFVLVKCFIMVLQRSLDIFSRLPVIHGFNRIGGVLFGMAQGTLVVWVVFMGLLFFIHYPAANDMLEIILQGRLSGFLFEHNLLNAIVLKIFP